MKATLLKNLYIEMLRIRRVEEAIAENYPRKEMKCPVHLSIGQEAVPVGLSACLTEEDRVYSTHRCHAHYLAKGGPVPEMIAELFGRATGCCRGKGGSMHLVAHEVGMMGASALVGGTIPLATGGALASLFEKKGRVSVAYFGDGASEEGILYESANFAALKNLPVLFVCENNLYATYSHQSARQANTQIHERVKAFGVYSVQADGNDVEEVYRISQEAVTRARKGQGPTFLEFKTYRWRDHVGPNFDIEVGYRTQAELDEWMGRCPIVRLEKKLISEKKLTEEEREAIELSIKKEISAAFEAARSAPFPDPGEIFTDIYA